MDFMHPEQHAAYTVIEVPFLGIYYEGAEHPDFERWPDTHGFNSILAIQGQFPELDSGNVEPFVQAWLYLGLLVEVLNRALGNNVSSDGALLITSRDFIRKSETSGEQIISTAGLEAQFNAWKSRAKDLGPTQKDEDKAYILHCLRVAKTFAQQALRPGPSSKEFAFSPLIQSSLVVLGSTLENYASIIYDQPVSNWPPSQLALDRLSQLCENEKDWIMSQFSSDCLWYKSTLRWQLDGKTHSNCSKDCCIASNINPNNYQTHHATESCKCSFIGLDMRTVQDSLRQDHIPLVHVHIATHDSPVLALSATDDSHCQDYVAVSHIWSDGLGNPSNNTLPQCRVLRIAQLVAKLLKRQDVTFWIDTLCVPLSGPEKKTAIRKMKATFEKAKTVLVLDGQLQNTHMDFGQDNIIRCDSLNDTLKIETIVRVALCGWMRRLWTFQEAAVSTELDIQFADGTVNLRQLMLSLRHVHLPIVNQAMAQLMILRSLRYDLDVGLQLTHFLNALKWRTTSKAEDEAICIAAMFDLSPERFVDLPLAKHMPTLITSLGTVPTALLFSKGPKLSTPNFTWAPLSFLNSQNKLNLTFEGAGPNILGFADNHGFLVTLSGWSTAEAKIQPPNGHVWWIEESQLSTAAASPTLLQVYRANDHDEIIEWNPSDFSEYPESSIGLAIKGSHSTILPTGTVSSFKGVCAALFDETPGSLTAKILFRVVIMICDYAELLTDIDINPTPVFRLREDQKWRFI